MTEEVKKQKKSPPKTFPQPPRFISISINYLNYPINDNH